MQPAPNRARAGARGLMVKKGVFCKAEFFLILLDIFYSGIHQELPENSRSSPALTCQLIGIFLGDCMVVFFRWTASMPLFKLAYDPSPVTGFGSGTILVIDPVERLCR